MATNWDKTNPQTGSALSSQAKEMRQNNTALDDALGRMWNYLTNYYLINLLLRTRGAHPTTPSSGKGKLYTKDVDGKAELHFKDESGNEVQIFSGGAFNYTASGGDVPAATPCYFSQNSAPSGWTTSATKTDSLLAVKGGTVYTGGGTEYGTWTQPDCTLTNSQIPPHTHPIQDYSESKPTITSGWTVYYRYLYGTVATGSVGGDPHNHGTTYRPYAITGIIATRDA